MKLIKLTFVLFLILENLTSCLVTTAPRNHYFIQTDNVEKNDPKVSIFSTPRLKNYVVTNVDMKAQVYIRSSIFENPNKFYLMKNQQFFDNEAKQFEFAKKDHKFYRTTNYKDITLKIINGENEKVVNYKMIEK